MDSHASMWPLKMKHATAKDVTAHVSQFAASSCVVGATVKKFHEYLNMVVDEVRWSDHSNHYDHSSHFPYLVTHFTRNALSHHTELKKRNAPKVHRANTTSSCVF